MKTILKRTLWVLAAACAILSCAPKEPSNRAEKIIAGERYHK